MFIKQEADVACGFSAMDSRLSNLISGHEASSTATPAGVNHSEFGSSRRSVPLVGQSPFLDNLSPFRSCSSKVSSPSLGTGGLGQSRTLSPNINRLAVFRYYSKWCLFMFSRVLCHIMGCVTLYGRYFEFYPRLERVVEFLFCVGSWNILVSTVRGN